MRTRHLIPLLRDCKHEQASTYLAWAVQAEEAEEDIKKRKEKNRLRLYCQRKKTVFKGCVNKLTKVTREEATATAIAECLQRKKYLAAQCYMVRVRSRIISERCQQFLFDVARYPLTIPLTVQPYVVPFHAHVKFDQMLKA
jgi:hypothetical protein